MLADRPLLLNLQGDLIDLKIPRVMGILNITPDSFYEQSRKQADQDILNRCDEILTQGGSIIDIGAYSSRPGAKHITQEEEMARLRHALLLINKEYPQANLSVDTFRADVARMCVEEYGVAIINDIAAGSMDDHMFQTVADLQVPYIMMHMQGTPQDMQVHPHYDHLEQEVMKYFSKKVNELYALGVNDIILDPGFGFGKSIDHNYEMLSWMEDFQTFELPILVGVSRKSMIYKLFDSTPQEALNGTTVLHTIALQKGANILRVHDVKEAVETIRIVEKMQSCEPKN